VTLLVAVPFWRSSITCQSDESYWWLVVASNDSVCRFECAA